MKNIFKIAVLLSLVTLIYATIPAKTEATTKSYCQDNYKALHKSLGNCLEAEKTAKTWLAINPVPDDIYATCRRGAGESHALLKECVLKERGIKVIGF